MAIKEVALEADLPFLPARMLHIGDIQLMYEAGRLRYISCKGNEVIRMIYPAVRDENWNTIHPDIENENIREDANGFVISYTALYNTAEIGYKADFTITGSDNTIVFTMNGEALSDFKSKRIGLCIHHPVLSCGGRNVDIIKADGTTAQYKFPTLVSPQRPFTDIQDMHWIASENESVNLSFEGSLFETEDQRNWSDNSFKTYSGPQYLVPMLQFNPGDTLRQQVTLEVKPATSPVKNEPVQQKELIKIPFPAIGYSRGTDQQPLTPHQLQLFKAVPFDHYRVELHLANAGWKAVLDSAVDEASELGTVLELAVYFQMTPSETALLIKQLKPVKEKIQAILILKEDRQVTTGDFFKAASQALKQALPTVRIGYGTDSWFADLNSQLPTGLNTDFVSFGLQPQVHQNDNRSILENLGSQSAIVETLHDRLRNMPVHISPITLNGSGGDDRLFTWFAAWWTINAIRNLGLAGHLTFYELTGERGLLRNNDPQSSPVYRLLKTIKDFSPVFILGSGEGVTIEDRKGERMHFIMKRPW